MSEASDVTTAKLGDAADFIRGVTFKPEDVITPDAPDAIVCMRTKNVQADLDQSDLIAVPPQFVKGDKGYLREGDVLVSTANSYNLVGKCCWVPQLPYKATAGGFICVFRPKPKLLDLRYFYWWMKSPQTQHDLQHCGRQTTNISNMDMKRAAKLDIPLPPLSEQRRVAAVLDAADALRRRHLKAADVAGDLLAALSAAHFERCGI